MKKVLFLLSCIFCLSIIVLPFTHSTVYAQTDSSQSSNINYFAFGDSITEGTVLTQNGNDGNENLQLKVDSDGSNYYTINRYPNLLVSQFENIGISNISYENHADASDTLDDFVSVYQSVDNLDTATLVTLCIGANDILGNAIKAIQTAIENSLVGIVSGSLSDEQLQNEINNQIETSMTEGAEYFYNNFENQLDQFLSQLNDRANVFVTTIYNPYQDVVLDFVLDISINSFVQIQKTVSISIDFSSLTEKYLTVDGDYAHPINKTIIEATNSLASSTPTQTLTLVDIYQNFNDYYLSQGIDNYKNLILVKDEIRNSPYEVSITNINDIDVNAIVNDLSYLLDPHLTDLGHKMFYNALWTQMESACSPMDFALDFSDGDSTTAISFDDTNTLDVLTNQTITLSSQNEFYLDIIKDNSTIYTSSTSQNSIDLPISQLENGNYNFRITPAGSSCYYDANVSLTISEPQEPADLEVFIDQQELTNGQSLEDIFVGESISLTTNRDVYVKIMSTSFEDELYTIDNTLNYTFNSIGNYNIVFYENDSSETPLFTLSISVVLDATIPQILDIEITSQNQGMGKIYSYTFEAVIDNPDNLPIEVYWKIGDKIIGHGQSITYTPTNTNDLNVVAYLSQDGNITIGETYTKTVVVEKDVTYVYLIIASIVVVLVVACVTIPLMRKRKFDYDILS